MHGVRLLFAVSLAILLCPIAAMAQTSQAAYVDTFDRVAKSSTSFNSRHTASKIPVAPSSELKRHPLWPALEMAIESYKHMRRDVHDYSCTTIRKERVNGVLRDREFMTAKVRHRRTRGGQEVVPFSVYLKVLGPKKVRGREVLYVAGQNDGEMLVRKGGTRFAFVTAKISPLSEAAMNGNRYPLTEFGMENLVLRLIEVVKEDMRLDVETKVEFFQDAKVDGRSCTGVRVTHPDFNQRVRFHTATVFVDNELKVPVHYEAYDWPKEDGGEPILLEQYTYRDIKLNQGFSNADFDASNPAYKVQ